MNKIDLIAVAKRATDGAHMCLWSKGNYQYEIEVFKSDYFTESDNFTCDYSDAKSKFEDMAEQVVTYMQHSVLYVKNMN